MCGRYTLTWPLTAMESELAFHAAPDLVLPRRYNIPPGADVLTVVARGSERYGGLMRWGMEAPWAPGRLVINARRETILERPMFRDAVIRRRAIVPADGYYEWDQATRQPYRIHAPDHRLWCFAAIYDHNRRLAIVTTAALPDLSHLHPRMPLILAPDTVGPWLDTSREAFRAVLAMAPPVAVSAYPVDKTVNRAAAESADLIRPLRDR